MITESSRYSKGVTTWVDHPTQGRVQIVHLQQIQWNAYPYAQHQTSSADTLDTIAHRTYGAATDYWFIAEMNPLIECPDDVQPGAIINIPIGRPR